MIGEDAHLEEAYEDKNGDPHGVGSPEYEEEDDEDYEEDDVEEEVEECPTCGAIEDVEICECPQW